MKGKMAIMQFLRSLTDTDEEQQEENYFLK